MGKRKEAAKPEPVVETPQAADDNMSSEEVYAELAAKSAEVSPQDARIAELEARLASAERALANKIPERSTRTPLDPDDPRLDEPVIAGNPTLRGDPSKPVKIHTYRELGVHPDDLDEGMLVNPETGQVVKCLFIKPGSGNLIEMP